MTNLSPLEIAELVCTRISHDLIGNIGAMCNAVELMEDDPSDIDDLKPLLKTSAQTLSSRLKFFRLAFGLKNALLKDVDEAKKIAEDYLQTIGSQKHPIVLEWNVQNVSLYKIVFLSLMSLADVFIRGGTMEVDESEDGLVCLARSEFELARQKLENMQKALSGNVPDENPALYAPLVCLKSLISQAGIEVYLRGDAKEAVLEIK
ncbi:MAG: hypothetical protein J5895_03585 [Alphaproteobacteria bacterium]|nr:hypothetical protein [Alphaproteobacteria bacterium]